MGRGSAGGGGGGKLNDEGRGESVVPKDQTHFVLLPILVLSLVFLLAAVEFASCPSSSSTSESGSATESGRGHAAFEGPFHCFHDGSAKGEEGGVSLDQVGAASQCLCLLMTATPLLLFLLITRSVLAAEGKGKARRAAAGQGQRRHHLPQPSALLALVEPVALVVSQRVARPPAGHGEGSLAVSNLLLVNILPQQQAALGHPCNFPSPRGISGNGRHGVGSCL